MGIVQKAARGLLLFEGFTNMLIFGPLMFLFPAEFGIAPFLPPGSEVDETAAAFARFFGGMISTLGGYCLFQGLRLGGEAEDLILFGFLVGDVLYVGGFAHWIHYSVKFWSAASIFNVVYGVILPFCRLIHLNSKWSKIPYKKH